MKPDYISKTAFNNKDMKKILRVKSEMKKILDFLNPSRSLVLNDSGIHSGKKTLSFVVCGNFFNALMYGHLPGKMTFFITGLSEEYRIPFEWLWRTANDCFGLDFHSRRESFPVYNKFSDIPDFTLKGTTLRENVICHSYSNIDLPPNFVISGSHLPVLRTAVYVTKYDTREELIKDLPKHAKMSYDVITDKLYVSKESLSSMKFYNPKNG